MKVLIVGSYGLVTGNLVARMHREKWDVYVLTGNQKNDKRVGMPKHISFTFEEDAADIKYVIQGIMPDYVIFTGAWDENYQWNREDCASAFNSGLVNVLSWAKEYRVPRFCYLSCMDAEEEGDVRGRLVRNGERICETYASVGFSITALRLPYVYGNCRCAEDTLDLLAEQCFLARSGQDYRLPRCCFTPLFVSDLAEAVYRVGREEPGEKAFACYEVKGKEELSGESFDGYIKALYPKSAGKASGKLALSDTEEIKTDDFGENFGYFPKIDMKTGLERVEAFLNKNQKKIEKIRKTREQEELLARKQSAREQIKKGLAKILRILENLVIFAIAFAAEYYLKGEIDAFAKVDFLLLYIVLIAIQRGVGESILAVILATMGNLWIALDQGGTVSSVMTQYQFVIQFLFYFVISIGITYSFLNYRNKSKERMEQLKELEEEYTRIIGINKTNIEIKKAFEDRLISYDDSIGKIYNVVSELDVLEVDKVIMAALRVVSKIMKVRDVSIFYAGTDQYFHFVGATTKDTGEQKTIHLSSYPNMERVLMEGEIYINHEIGGILPRMAAPIFSGNKLVYIIMLWNMEFEELNLYKKNLFLVLVKLITSSLEKGYQYETIGRSQEYYEDTNIMLPESFKKKIVELMKGKTQEEAEYTLLQIKTEERGRDQLNRELGGLLRDSDRIGYLKDEDHYIYVLAHTSFKDSEFVVRKLAREGFQCRVVTSNET